MILGIAATAAAATIVTASVRVGLAEAEFARCEARWSPDAFALRDDAFARELSGLDGQLEAALDGTDPAAFAPGRWSGAQRAELERSLASVEPLIARLVAVVESPRVQDRLRETSIPTRVPKLAIGRSWANVLAARAVLAEDDREAAAWIARGLDLNDLRCGTSTIGVMLHCAFDAITLGALRERAASPSFDPAPYLDVVEPRLVRRDATVPWRELGRAEATLIVSGAAGLTRGTCGDPTEWWDHADGLETLTSALRGYEAIAEGAIPEPTEFLPAMIFDGLVKTRHDAGEWALLARVALRVAAYEREHAELPRVLGAVGDDVATRALHYELDGERAVLEAPGRRPKGVAAPAIARWTIAGR